jgi:hypothetical protein
VPSASASNNKVKVKRGKKMAENKENEGGEKGDDSVKQ